jgi:hypothetical protein
MDITHTPMQLSIGNAGAGSFRSQPGPQLATASVSLPEPPSSVRAAAVTAAARLMHPAASTQNITAPAGIRAAVA